MGLTTGVAVLLVVHSASHHGDRVVTPLRLSRVPFPDSRF